MGSFKKYWADLQARERLILGWGAFIVTAILLYALLFQPLYRALAHMESALPDLRKNVVWMRQTDQLLDRGGSIPVKGASQGADQSLQAVIVSTAQQAKVRKSIQTMVPDQTNNEIRVLLEDADFNQWLVWVDTLYKRYGVDIRQVTAERDDDKPNIAEIRVTFFRGS